MTQSENSAVESAEHIPAWGTGTGAKILFAIAVAFLFSSFGLPPIHRCQVRWSALFMSDFCFCFSSAFTPMQAQWLQNELPFG